MSEDDTVTAVLLVASLPGLAILWLTMNAHRKARTPGRVSVKHILLFVLGGTLTFVVGILLAGWLYLLSHPFSVI